MKSNIGVCPFLSSLNINSDMTRETFSIRILNSPKLLGVKIDTNLSFNEHVFKICKKAGMKIAALARWFPYRTLNEKEKFNERLFYATIRIL